MHDLLGLNTISNLENRADNIENNVNRIDELVSSYKKLTEESKMADDFEMEEIDLKELDNYTVIPEIVDADFGVTLKITGDKKNEIVMALLLSGYKISLKDESLILIEEGQERFY